MEIGIGEKISAHVNEFLGKVIFWANWDAESLSILASADICSYSIGKTTLPYLQMRY
jgi:hypothetical protein